MVPVARKLELKRLDKKDGLEKKNRRRGEKERQIETDKKQKDEMRV